MIVTLALFGLAVPVAHATPTAPAVAQSAAGYPLPDRLAGNEYPTFYGGYRTVAAFQQFPRDLAAAYPELVEVVDFGDSWLKTKGRGGYDLLAVRITGDVAAQPAYDSDAEHRPRFALAAQIHAREIITSEVAWRYVTELVDGYGTNAQVTALLDSTEVWVVLQVNPDGAAMVESGLAGPDIPFTEAGDAMPGDGPAWQRKNANDEGFVAVLEGMDPDGPAVTARMLGVDLNRNFDAFWLPSATDSADETYPGVAAGSEPETIAKVELLTALFGEFAVSDATPAPSDHSGTFVNLHSCQGTIGYPYSYSRDVIAPNADAMKASVFRQSYANHYVAGSIAETLYPSAGTETDWVYARLGIPAYTYEVGDCMDGFFFPNYSRVATLYDEVMSGIRFAASAAYAPYTASLGGVIETVSALAEPDGSITVAGSATDEMYGPSDIVTAPAVTPIVAVEAALATDMNAITDTVALTIDASAPTAPFAGTISAEDARAGGTLFVRAKNGSGQWGPWRTPDQGGVFAAKPVEPTPTATSALTSTSGEEPIDVRIPVLVGGGVVLVAIVAFVWVRRRRSVTSAED